MAAPQVRWNALLEMLSHDGRIEVEAAAAELGVSTATIRRDLDELAHQQVVTRTHGGATVSTVTYDLPLRYRAARNAPEKRRIARAAAGLATAGSVVGLNGGTTTTALARELATRAGRARSTGASLTVVTNALNIAGELVGARHIKLVVTGGAARPASYELVGPLATEVLAEITLDQVFIGVDGIDVAHGATAHHEAEASINQELARRAGRVVVVADSTKLDKRAFARICPVADVQVLVTDSGASPELVEPFTTAGVRVVRA
ncbi:alkaline phosphatase [Wenjunlia vitaminophila]|uniref:Alkaline phosphatase n=1 Tax=Wenjunlia vitaminophila TaxID=76728 RepID=A0A0T6LU11_WENVI|nr:DeoR/GlpR family DNA-binding transcription regulator [Wenjunlia vitaminophila]KRV49546.1 alkaline phosphatase [Wenjunlia vitaminophila]